MPGWSDSLMQTTVPCSEVAQSPVHSQSVRLALPIVIPDCCASIHSSTDFVLFHQSLNAESSPFYI